MSTGYSTVPRAGTAHGVALSSTVSILEMGEVSHGCCCKK